MTPKPGGQNQVMLIHKSTSPPASQNAARAEKVTDFLN